MINVIGVCFQENGKMIPYDAGILTPNAGEYVIVETDHGNDLGQVIMSPREIDENSMKRKPMKAVRIATAQDIDRATENRAKEREAFRVCNQKILEHKLEMKLVSVEALFDNSKMLFYFTANGRVDFRALVKDLAAIFRTRIELRQIGVRDEARMLGGLGPCGRPICCGSFLNDFQPVSIRMAKEQNLSLNPTKISGVCGRLMCCLKYEQDQYEQVRKRMPRVGREVVTPDGNGTVSDLNIVKETVFVRIPNGDATEIREYSLEQISRPGASAAAETIIQEMPSEQENSEAVTEAEETEVILEEDISVRMIGMSEEELYEKFDEPKEERGPKKSRSSRPHPEQRKSRKTDEGEKNRENKENRDGRENPRNGRAKKDEKAGAAREQKFGQPVRRENPNKAGKTPQAKKEDVSTTAQKPVEKETKKAEQKKNRNWAAAVEKALQATEPEQR